MLHPRNPPHRETQIPRYLAVQIQIEFWFEFVPRNWNLYPEEFQFLDLVNLGGTVFSVETAFVILHTKFVPS